MNASKIFEHQQTLIDKFHHIEKANFPHTYSHPVCHDLDSFDAQARIRDYAWRITEEVIEAETARPDMRTEELIDVLHFVAELFIFIEIPPASLQLGNHDMVFDPAPQSNLYRIITQLGLAINQLKNKAWKQKSKPTDADAFYFHMRNMWNYLMQELTLQGLTAAQIQDAYLDKASINHNRVKDGV